jgi:hypothetical protein
MGRMLAELLRCRPKAAAPPAGARWSAWARALAGRHLRADARARPPAMALVAPRGPATRWSWTGLVLHPRLELVRGLAAPGHHAARTDARPGGARSAPAGAVAPAPARARLATASPRAGAPVVLAAPPSARTRERVAGMTLERCRLIVRHLVEGRARREEPRGLPAPGRPAPRAAAPSGTAPAPWAQTPRRGGTLARPPAMVLATPSAPGARDRPPEVAARLAAGEHPQAARPPRAPVSDAPIDIGSLTDQVVRQLDRRIVAQRERMGRI